jgi:uncharacterized protein YyaL (SSP411 family)
LAPRYLPAALVVQLPDDISGLPAALVKPAGAMPQAWICRGQQCLPPITDIEFLIAALSQPDANR